VVNECYSRVGVVRVPCHVDILELVQVGGLKMGLLWMDSHRADFVEIHGHHSDLAGHPDLSRWT